MRFLLVPAFLIIASACGKSGGGTCPSGEVFQDGACVRLCEGSAGCPAGACCDGGLCVVGATCAPVIYGVNGTGTVDRAIDHADNHLIDRLVILGEHLLGTEVLLASQAGGPILTLETCGTGTAAQMTVALPDALVPGNYTLTVRNAAGECPTTFPLIQGEQGNPGSPDTGAGILSKLASVDGAGSGLDADALQGASIDEIVAQAVEAAVPVGTILPFAGAQNAVPAGWLPCDGREVSRTTYGALFAMVSITYGVGDQVNTFNLPDLRGRLVVGVGQGTGLSDRVLGSVGGEENHTLTINEMPAHNHSISGIERAINTDGNAGRCSGGVPSGSITIGDTGGGLPHNSMPPYLTLGYIIKY